jgi:predicted ATPase
MKKRWSTPGPYLRRVSIDPKRVNDWDVYPFNLPAIRNLGSLTFHPKVTFFVGENGSGKSTLLEAVAVCCHLNPEGGSANFKFSTKETHSALHWSLDLVKETNTPGDRYFLRAESFYNVASKIDELDVNDESIKKPPPPIINSYGGVSLHEQSHGESFYALFQNRFHGHGLYFMDEPEAALSPRRQIQFLSLLHDFVNEGSQFIIATHSPIIMGYPQAHIFHFEKTGLKRIGYTDTEHYLLTRGFLANPARTFEEMFQPPAKGSGS